MKFHVVLALLLGTVFSELILSARADDDYFLTSEPVVAATKPVVRIKLGLGAIKGMSSAHGGVVRFDSSLKYYEGNHGQNTDGSGMFPVYQKNIRLKGNAGALKNDDGTFEPIGNVSLEYLGITGTQKYQITGSVAEPVVHPDTLVDHQLRMSARVRAEKTANRTGIQALPRVGVVYETDKGLKLGARAGIIGDMMWFRGLDEILIGVAPVELEAQLPLAQYAKIFARIEGELLRNCLGDWASPNGDEWADECSGYYVAAETDAVVRVTDRIELFANAKVEDARLKAKFSVPDLEASKEFFDARIMFGVQLRPH